MDVILRGDLPPGVWGIAAWNRRFGLDGEDINEYLPDATDPVPAVSIAVLSEVFACQTGYSGTVRSAEALSGFVTIREAGTGNQECMTSLSIVATTARLATPANQRPANQASLTGRDFSIAWFTVLLCMMMGLVVVL
ncbi:hypothetical protein [Acetobacter musti]